MFRTPMVAALVALSLFAQSQQTATPSSATQQAGIILGSIETERAGARAPVRRAKVTLTREGSRSQVIATTTTTGGAGYRFDGLAPGRYIVTAEKPGFVTRSSEPFDVPARTADLVLIPGGALEGRLQDDRNAPIARLAISADRLTDQGAVAASYLATTDDLGRFRIHSLPAGRYHVRATPPPPASGDQYFYPGTTKASDAGVISVTAGTTSEPLGFTVPVAPLSPIAAAAIEAAAQTASEPAPDPKAARVTGTITRSDSGQPIANATVQLVGSGSRVPLRAKTGLDGRFEIAGVPASTWVLSATAAGFVSVDAAMNRPTGAGVRLTLKEAERLRQDITLAPTSAIEGRVLDEFGDPAPGVVVQVAQRLAAVGLWRFLTNSVITTTGTTDDRGWFRAPGLFPGDYYLIAVPQPFEKSWMTGFAPTFFPGFTTADAATAISIVAGRDVYDARFALSRARTSSIVGQVVDSLGQPVPGQIASVNAVGRLVPNAQVLLMPVEGGEVRAMVMARITPETDGTFTFNDVPEGSYVIQANAPTMFGVIAVTVDANREPRPTRVTVKPLTTARGRVIFEGDAPAPSADPGNQIIAFQPTNFTMGPIGGNRTALILNADWSFEIPGLAWFGVLRVSPPTGWALARVRHEGRDITDTPFDFQSADVSGLEVVLTNRVGTVSGTVASGGQPAAKTGIVVIGADDASWTYLTRTMRNATTDDRGTFTVGGLLPGRYMAVVTSAELRLADHASLLAMRSLGVPFTVSERANTVVTLTLPR